MTAYSAETATNPGGGVITERSGTASSDTVPAGALVLWRNTGAGSHTVTLTTSNTVNGLAVADQTISLAAGQVKASRILWDWQASDGTVAVAIDGTASEVKYYVLGGA